MDCDASQHESLRGLSSEAWGKGKLLKISTCWMASAEDWGTIWKKSAAHGTKLDPEQWC